MQPHVRAVDQARGCLSECGLIAGETAAELNCAPMVSCPCAHPIASYHVALVEGEKTLVGIHEDSVCELPLHGEGEAVLRRLLREGDDEPTA